MEFKVYQASFVLNDFHRQATDVIDPTPPTPPTIWKTVSGNPIQILDAVASPMQKCEVTLEPIQDLHGQDAPYPAGGGKNKWNPASTPVTPASYWAWEIPYETSMKVTLIEKDTSVDISGCYFGASLDGTTTNLGWLINNGTIGRTTNTYTVQHYIIMYPQSAEVLEKLLARFNIMVAVDADIDAPYSPVANICPITGWTGCEVWVKPEYDTSLPSTASVTFPNSAGTVYGGTVDLVSGVLTVDRAIIDLGSLSWLYRAGNKIFYANVPLKRQYATGVVNTIIASSLKTVADRARSAPLDDGCICNRTGSGEIQILVGNTTYTTPSAFISFITGTQLVYYLEEPVTYQLTPQQVSTNDGENNVWGDGTIELTYLGLE